MQTEYNAYAAVKQHCGVFLYGCANGRTGTARTKQKGGNSGDTDIEVFTIYRGKPF